MKILSKIKDFVNKHLSDIILLIGVVLISLLSFAMGYIVAKQQEKEPIRIEGKENSVLFFTFSSINGSLVIEYRIQNL